MDGSSGGLGDAEFAEKLLEEVAVFRAVDGFGGRTENAHSGFRQGLGEIDRGLAAELDDHAFHGRFGVDDVENVFHGERLEVEAVGDV